MTELFYDGVLNKFNGDISKWDVSSVENMTDVFEKCPIKEEYKPEFKKIMVDGRKHQKPL